MAKIEPFEKFTRQYEDWFEEHSYVYESELKAVRMLLPEYQNGVEIGVGSGRFAVPLGGLKEAWNHRSEWVRLLKNVVSQ